ICCSRSRTWRASSASSPKRRFAKRTRSSRTASRPWSARSRPPAGRCVRCRSRTLNEHGSGRKLNHEELDRRNHKDHKDHKDGTNHKDHKDHKDGTNHKDHKDHKDGRTTKITKTTKTDEPQTSQRPQRRDEPRRS